MLETTASPAPYQHPWLFRILQVSAFAVFLGRAWQHLFWDAPFRTFLWEEAWMSRPVKVLLGMDWTEYVTSPTVDLTIQWIIKGFGVWYLLLALTVLFIRRLPKPCHHLLWMGSLSLILLAAMYLKVKFFSLGQFFEYTLQFGSPLFLFAYLRSGRWSGALLLAMKVAVGLTFICHGLYAYGYYPLPGNFMQMVINILGLSNAGAELYLKVAAILDFIVGVTIFLPGPYVLAPLAWAVIWGSATTLARIWANVYWDFWLESLHRWVFESVYRLPHFLIPLLLFLYFFQKWKGINPQTPTGPA